MTTMAEQIANATNQVNQSTYYLDYLGLISIMSFADGESIYDGVTSAVESLNNALDSIPVSGGTIFFPSTSNGSTYFIDDNITIPENVSLQFADGAKISRDTGITIIGNNTKIIAGQHQIFSGLGTLTGTWTSITPNYPQWFGSDDIASINLAIAFANISKSKIVDCGAYTYTNTTNAEINMSYSNVTLDLNNCNITSGVADGDYTINASGSLSDSYEIQSAITYGDKEIELTPTDVANISAGDFIKVTTDEKYFELASGTEFLKGEMLEVESTDPITGIITVKEYIKLSYSVTALTPVVRKIIFVENIKIIGGNLDGVDTDDGRYGILLSQVKKAKVKNTYQENFKAGIIIGDSYNIDVYGNVLNNINKALTGYGIAVQGVTQKIKVHKNISDNCRHFFTTGGIDGVAMFNEVFENDVKNSTDFGIDCHGNTRFLTIRNNNIDSCVGGITTRSPFTTITGNAVNDCYSHGIYSYEAGGINVKASNNLINNCGKDFKDAIKLDMTATVYETCKFVEVDGNIIADIPNGVGITVDGADGKNISVCNNKLNNIGYNGIVVTTGYNIICNGNIFKTSERPATNTLWAIYIEGTAAGSRSLISVCNNIVDEIYNGIYTDNGEVTIIQGNNMNYVTTPYSIAGYTVLRNNCNFPDVLSATFTWEPGAVVDAIGYTFTGVTVTGAALGDFVEVAMPYDQQGCIVQGYVQAANTIDVRIQNETGGTKTFASGTWKVRVLK